MYVLTLTELRYEAVYITASRPNSRAVITHSEEATGILKSCSEEFVQTDDPINTWGTIVPTDSAP